MKLKHNYIYPTSKPKINQIVVLDMYTNQVNDYSKPPVLAARVTFISYINILTSGKKYRIGKLKNEDI
jgi:hypothetical protein